MTKSIISVFLLFSVFSLIYLMPYAYAEPNFNANNIAQDKWVKDNYIIKFNGDEPDMSKYKDLIITHEYNTIFKGIAVEASPAELRKLMKDASIELIEPVQLFTLDFIPSINAIPPDIETKQYIKPGTTRHNFHINPSVNAGDGVTNVPLIIAVVDTGCTLEHPDLNYIECHDFTNSIEGIDDLSGHGTHVAGTIAAINNGFGVVGGAPGAGIIGLKVCGGGGSGSCPSDAILGGWDWLAANGKDKGVLVSNNSWGGSRSGPVEDGNCGFTDGDIFHQALCAMTDEGIVTVMSAGNGNSDGANFLGCGFDEVICVSAMDDTDGLPGGLGPGSTCRSSSDDTIASFSNYGLVVDISADGVCEPSTVPDCSNGESICHPSGYLEISGTSMSGPQATGGIALAIVHLCGFDGCNNREEVLAVNNFIKATGFDINGPDGFSCNKPSGCVEPLLNVATYTFEPREPFHDVSLTLPSVADSVGLGFTEEVSFSTINIGTFEETYTVELRINSILVFTDTVTLGELKAKSYTVEWIPDTLGTSILTTNILDLPVEDTNPDNNGGTTEIEVIERIRDIEVRALTDIKPNNWVAGVGCKNCLRLTIFNNGNFAESLNTKLTHVDSGVVILDRGHTLRAGDGISFIVDVKTYTMTILDGVNTFRGETSILPGDDPSDNVLDTEIIASEENRHHNIRSVFLIADKTTWVEDEQNRLRLWCTNDGTETFGIGDLSFGILNGEDVILSESNIKVLPHGEGEIQNMFYQPFQLAPGDYTLTGFCDYLNEYDERNETNNKETLDVTILPAEPEPSLPPIADAGPDQTVDNETLVNLDGSGSSDPNGDDITYLWSIMNKPGESEASIINPTFVNPTITPDIAGNYIIALIVNDGEFDSGIDSVTIIAKLVTPPPPDPEPPMDRDPPVLVFITPTEGDVVSGKIKIRVSAQDASAIVGVSVYIDGKRVKSIDKFAPYQWDFQTRSKKGLNHTLEARACDVLGNCSSESINFMIRK